jgi:hypothetical protein
MDPRRFLELALILKGGRGTPENYRSAISRAYYAAFNVGVETCKAIGIQLNDGPSGHGELRDCLGACGDSDLDRTSDLLKMLHRRRRQADYRMDDPESETRKEADLAYLESKQIIEAFDELKSEKAKDVARSEMKRYARDVRQLRVTEN